MPCVPAISVAPKPTNGRLRQLTKSSTHMPFVTRPCGARLHYLVRGNGPTVLLLAPGGMRSCIANWANQPFDALTKLQNKFRVIAMDQRCGAGSSDGPLPAGGDTLRDDNKLLDGMDNEFSQTGALLDSARNKIDGLVKSRCETSVASLPASRSSPDWVPLTTGPADLIMNTVALDHTCAI